MLHKRVCLLMRLIP